MVPPPRSRVCRGSPYRPLCTLAQRPSCGGPVHGVIFRGRRYDTGDKGDYLRAVVRLACQREDQGSEFRSWLKDFVGSGELDEVAQI